MCLKDILTALNCTIIELKYDTQRVTRVVDDHFESYYYGVEMTIEYLFEMSD